MHTYGSALLKQNKGLAYYYSNKLVEIAIQGYKVDEGQVSDISLHTSKPARATGYIRLLKQWQYLGIVLWYVQAYKRSQFDCSLERNLKNSNFFKFCPGVQDMRTTCTMSL